MPEAEASPVMERRAEQKRFRVGSFMGGGAIGAAVAGPASAYLARREAFETLDWITKNGLAGFLLVALSLLGGFSLWALRALLKSEAARRDDEAARRVEAQGLLREQLVALPQLTTALAESNTLNHKLARLLARVVSDDDTPPTGTGIQERHP